ncbi:hypothetical protein L202_01849 [Cryptococcus amylolentus CBS 6039]|uniref:Zn(2)-C6 fungal-type domain-containing protein n=1 Tax=Cryptococcus amylolentus CBS 6039 TaxID=1295533 RepID=A0A1E3I5H6_9TREE|nr:hypothetical protein L202_01849 [Cryptococcus amylolentus CBS 6039]ODN83758.1 hypothetical protein L202_01849 [Cryptococcus amylolentus CBS 6039]
MSDDKKGEERVLDPSEIRWKMAVACDVCRRRKVRCDGERPCSRCAKANIECTFSLPKHVIKKATDVGAKRKAPGSLRGDEFDGNKRRATSSAEPAQMMPVASTSAIPATVPRTHMPNASASIPPRRLAIDQSPSHKRHLLLVDKDDQLVYSGPSSGMPMFDQMGVLKTVEISEGQASNGNIPPPPGSALGYAGAHGASRDYFDLCAQKCPVESMHQLIKIHFQSSAFFPLLHFPSFYSEFVACTQRRLRCTPQYGALLMSILAVTARLVESARPFLHEKDRQGELFYEVAQDLLKISTNKLDIRHILALYHLATFAECKKSSAGEASSFVSEAIGLGFTTGLHRNASEFQMDPVTSQIRTRLFWALYRINISLAYSQGRPSLILLSDCSVDFPAIIDNEYITKSAMGPQPDDRPSVIMAGAVKNLETFMVLEQVLSIINAPANPISQRYSVDSADSRKGDRFQRAETRLQEIERSLPPYLREERVPSNNEVSVHYIVSSRIRSSLLFVRILMARQALVEEFESSSHTGSPAPTDATITACRLSIDCISMYARLKHLDYLQYSGFYSVSHITAAAHTLIACMVRSTQLAQAHRQELMSAIDLLRLLSRRFTCSEPAAVLLLDLTKSLDLNNRQGGSSSDREAVAIRVLARKMAVSPSAAAPIPLPPISRSASPSSQPPPPPGAYPPQAQANYPGQAFHPSSIPSSRIDPALQSQSEYPIARSADSDTRNMPPPRPAHFSPTQSLFSIQSPSNVSSARYEPPPRWGANGSGGLEAELNGEQQQQAGSYAVNGEYMEYEGSMGYNGQETPMSQPGSEWQGSALAEGSGREGQEGQDAALQAQTQQIAEFMVSGMPQMVPTNAPASGSEWAANFSFLNDGLFGPL